MIQLSDDQINRSNSLDKETLVIIVSSLQNQLLALQSQLDHTNVRLSDNTRQIELLTEQICIMNQRFFGRKSEESISEVNGQHSMFDSFNEAEYLKHNSLKELGITEVVIPFIIGRKNFVLIESSNGAKASAILYSLVETAKANMVNTFEYLTHYSLKSHGI